MKFSETLYRDVDEEESLIAMGGRFVLFSKREREREGEKDVKKGKKIINTRNENLHIS